MCLILEVLAAHCPLAVFDFWILGVIITISLCRTYQLIDPLCKELLLLLLELFCHCTHDVFVFPEFMAPWLSFVQGIWNSIHCIKICRIFHSLYTTIERNCPSILTEGIIMLCYCPWLPLSDECYTTCTGICWTCSHTAQTFQCVTYMSSPPQESAIKTGTDWWRNMWCVVWQTREVISQLVCKWIVVSVHVGSVLNP